jgi:hypothetical protein
VDARRTVCIRHRTRALLTLVFVTPSPIDGSSWTARTSSAAVRAAALPGPITRKYNQVVFTMHSLRFTKREQFL